MDHAELIREMPDVEQMPTQDRLILAKQRRKQQLKLYQQKDKEHSRKTAKHHKSTKRNIYFNDSVVLLEAAARNDLEEVKRLLSKGVSPDSCNEDGLTALHQSCIDDNEPMLMLLLDHGANVNAEDTEKWTPLHAAATCAHIRLVKILITRGANLLAVNADGNMPYDICEDETALDYIEGEMAKRGVTQELIDETRAATEKKMLIDMKELYNAGGDLEAHDNQGATPLHIAAANGYISVVEFLLDHGVPTDLKDKDDWQPSHAAACWGHLEVIELLAQAGANLNAKNKHDETPSDICEDNEIKERITALRTEQDLKRQQEAKKAKVRRSQSNTRTQSVRRTSLREKGLSSKKDVVNEANRLRMALADKKGLDTADIPRSSPTVDNANAYNHNSYATNNNNYNNTSSGIVEPPRSPIATESNAIQVIENRSAPEGKDDDSLMESSIMDTKENTYTDVNGKVTVHVVVTINGNGTLADLKKQRSQIRNNSSDVASLTSPLGSVSENDSVTPSSDIIRFTGTTTEENVEYAKPKRCCCIQ
ncbi:unnamed protein product [Brassicogethes aeneus]|uniref:Protein phosphatase 1 regulatory subunit 16A n=1 Tax=Brassicogethes aeneus TaxID=1431903 RepID=A0A9P0FAY0_BRAAE|nr:unnamed protein product [Brassicogethes aeneus]